MAKSIIPQPTQNTQKYKGGFGLAHWLQAVIRGAWILQGIEVRR